MRSKIIVCPNSSLRLCSIILLAAYCLLPTANGQQTTDYARWVNPFIGTGGHGHTFPGAVLPFGMVQLSPDTRTDNWDGSSGYHYSDNIIYGFSHTHLSGTGIPDGCDILFMPTINSDVRFAPFDINAKKGGRGYNTYYASTFSHDDEIAEPGYYSVRIDDGKLRGELTATKRAGFHRYTFPQSNDAAIRIDLLWRDEKLDANVKLVGDRRVEGFRHSASWAKNQKVYFVAVFSKPFLSAGGGGDYDSGDNGVTLAFKTRAGEQVLVKVGISSVSIEGARKNLAAELPGWDFDKVRADARAAWNKELSKIEVSGGTDAQTTTFYTALYHTMIHPSLFSDVDGSYRGLDGKIHQLPGYAAASPAERRSSASPNADNNFSGSAAPSGERPSRANRNGPGRKSTAFPLGEGSRPEQYTVFSLWDTFRAAHPLYTIIEQKRTVDFINTFIRMYEQGGRLPVWELWGNETDTMIGYHAVSVIADAMAKGIKGFDYEKAYEAAKHSAELDRDGLAAYKKRGYISSEDENESVSKTLEYAYDDWCIAQMGLILATQRLEDFNKSHKIDFRPDRFYSDYRDYSLRAHSFENLFDPSTGFMRPKRNGGFVSPFAPNEVTFSYTEGNAWVYTFFVPQDIGGLMTLMGGRDKFAAKLDELFTTSDKLAGREQPDITGLIGQYAHGNEPSHHIAYLFNYAGEPWKTQRYVRQIMDEFYKPEPDGLIGNEDCGQMSAWYVMSASGLYQVTPGSPFLDIGTPLFPLVKYHLENGKTFTIRANGVSSAKKYVRSVRLNGVALRAAVVPYEEIEKGGALEFEMADQPAKSAFAPFNPERSRDAFPAVPIIDGPGRVFSGQASITLRSTDPNVQLLYSTDSTEPHTPYTGPIVIDRNTDLAARAVDKMGRPSLLARASFYKRPNNWTVKIDSKYSRQYTGGGDEGLVDGIRGSTNFASGEWQGYQGQDFVATVDLQKETEIRNVGAGFLQVARSWIWMPTHVQFEVSDDGINFRPVADIKTDVAVENMDPVRRDYRQAIPATKARYVRVHAYNLGKIPSWHPGAGSDAYIFVDEILID